MGKKLTQEEFELNIEKSIGKDYKILGNYINNKTNIKMKHLLCGKTFTSKPMSMTKRKNPTGCPHCFGTPKKSIEILRKEVNDIYGENIYTILNKEYTGNKMNIEILCNKCDKIFTTKPYRITSNKNGCPHCAGLAKLTISDMQEQIDVLKGKEFVEILDGNTKNLKVHIKKCNHVYDNLTFGNLKLLKECRICSNKVPHTLETINNEFNKVGSEYMVVSKKEYINDKHTLLHKKCGKTFTCYYTNFKDRDQRCPYCKDNTMSLPEKRIYEFLESHNINFSYSVRPKWLYRLKPLEIDFLLDDNFCIEYDGEFHFKEMYKSQNLSIGRLNDLTKNKILFEKEFKLIRIPYKYKRHINKIMKKIIFENTSSLIDIYPLLYISDPKNNFSYNINSYYDIN